MISKNARLGRLEALLGFHLRRSSGVFRRDFEQAVEGLDLRQVSLAILSVISANPGIKQGAIGALLDIKRSNMVNQIAELVDRGLVIRAGDPNDRRAIVLALTAKGTTLLETALARIEAHEDRLLRGFTDAERGLLVQMLERIAANGAGGN